MKLPINSPVPICRSRSAPCKQNRRLWSVPPGNRPCRRTYQYSEWSYASSPFWMIVLLFRSQAKAFLPSSGYEKSPAGFCLQGWSLCLILRLCKARNFRHFPIPHPGIHRCHLRGHRFHQSPRCQARCPAPLPAPVAASNSSSASLRASSMTWSMNSRWVSFLP